MRKSILLIAACGALLLALLLIFWMNSDDLRGLLIAPNEAQARSSPSLEPSRVELGDEAQRETVADFTPELVQDAAGATLGAADEVCVVQGRLIDEDGLPLANVGVRLFAYKLWTAGVDVDRLSGDHDYRGWELSTDETGRFRFEAPVPTKEVCVLEVRPDLYHDLYKVYFGGDRDSNRARLTAGTVDLGDIRLATTGAISGRVVDEAGLPLFDVRMGVGSSRSSTYGRDARTDETGAYVIGHLVPGEYGVKAALDGYLSVFETPFEVTRRRTTSGVDFTLLDAPTIRGHVVTPAGTPVAGARLWGWPKSSGSGAGADSAEDGSFTIYLPQDEPYNLGVEHAGFVSFEDRRTFYEPGRDDIVITLEPSQQTRFVVVADSDGTPIEKFGLRIVEGTGSLSTTRPTGWIVSPPNVLSHPNGEVDLTARPGFDRFELVAPGYLPLQGEIEHESPESNRQVIRLASGGTLTGRAMRNGAPVPGASVTLERGGRVGGVRSVRRGEIGVEGPPEKLRFRAASEATWKRTTDEDGRFSFAGLSAGEHRLDIVVGDGNALRVHPIELARGEQRDLGDLEVVPGGTITGTVLVPPNCALAGLRIDLGARGANATTDAEGRFRFEGLVAGEHALAVHSVPGRLANCPNVWVEVEAGEAREVVLDVRDRGMCKVSLTIDSGRLPREGMIVSLSPTRAGETDVRLGITDAEGHVSGSVHAIDEALISLRSRDGFLLHCPEPRLQLTAGGEVDAVVPVVTGSVVVELGAGIDFPQRGDLRLSFGLGAAERDVYGLRILDGKFSSSRVLEVDSSGRIITIPWVFVGTRTISIEITSHETKPSPFSPEVTVVKSSAVTYSASRQIVVQEGSETRVRF